jgi:hypothetical protein
MLMRSNDQARRFWSSPVGFENQSLSTQFTNKFRRLTYICKPQICVNLGELRLTISDSFNTPLLAILLAATLLLANNCDVTQFFLGL